MKTQSKYQLNMLSNELLSQVGKALPWQNFAWVKRFGACMVEVTIFCISANAFGQNMTVLGRWPFGPCKAIHAIDNLVYVGNGSSIDVVDVSNQLELQTVGSIKTGSMVVGFQHRNQELFVLSYGEFSIYDISRPTTPQLLGSCPIVKVDALYNPVQLFRMAILGDYAYFCYDGLNAIDISNLRHPHWTGKIEGNFRDIASDEELLYTISSDNPELMISGLSDDWNINVIGNIALNSNCLRLFKSDSVLFIWGEHLFTVNISDPARPDIVSRANFQTHEVLDFVVQEDHLIAVNGIGGLNIIDVSNPFSPQQLYRNHQFDFERNVVKLENSFAVADGSLGMHIYQISEDSISLLATYPVGGKVHQLNYRDGFLYIANGLNGLQILNASLPDSLFVVGEFIPNDVSLRQRIVSVDVRDNLAYILISRNGLMICDVSDNSSPVQLGTFRWRGGNPHDLILRGHYAFVVVDYYGISILDVSNSEEITEIGRLLMEEPARITWGICLDENYLYWADGSRGLNIVDVNDLTNPRMIGNVAWDGTNRALNVAVLNHTAYVASEWDGLALIDVEDVTNPEVVEVYRRGNNYQDIKIVDEIAYTALGILGVEILDLSNPIRPRRLGGFDENYFASTLTVDASMVWMGDDDNGVFILRNDLLSIVELEKASLKSPILSNYPNPFNGQTLVTINLPNTDLVSIDVIDASGAMVQSCYQGWLNVGKHTFLWKATGLPSGMYYYRLRNSQSINVLPTLYIK